MTVTTTNRLLMSKPDNAELVSIALINANMDKVDSNFVPAARMRSSVLQTIANNTVTTIGYNTTDYDSYAARSEGPMVNLTNDTITIRKAGLYYIINRLSFVPNATNIRRLDFIINGSIDEIASSPGYATTNNSMYTSVLRVLAVNDVLSAACFQNSGANLDTATGSGAAILSCVWLGNIS